MTADGMAGDELPQYVSPRDMEELLAELERSPGEARLGFFGPSSITWRVNRESAVFLAGSTLPFAWCTRCCLAAGRRRWPHPGRCIACTRASAVNCLIPSALILAASTMRPMRCRRSAGSCLLYTSDAADDLLCVDLGGR